MGVDLVIVRHGRTEWNREVRFRGRMDLPLDEMGQAQARAAAQAIHSRWPQAAAVYSSPLLRARQTAESIAAALGLVVEIHEGLLDLDYGKWTGRTPAEVAQSDPGRYQQWLTAPDRVRFPGGGSLPGLQEGLLRMLGELEQRHTGQTVVLLGHLVVNRVLLCTLLGLELGALWKLGQEPAAINLARIDDGVGQVLFMNDACHLAQLQG